MKATTTSILFSLALYLGKTSACDCLFIGNFCETITYQNNGQIHAYLHVFHLKVSTKQANGITAFVSKTYFGENLVGHTLNFENGSGADCGLFVTNFQVDEEYIVAAHQVGDAWRLSECGITFLKVENGFVNGAVAPGISQVALSDFQNVANCGELNPAIEIPEQPDFELYVKPTLASNELTIKTNHLFSAELDLHIFDVTGRLIYEQKVPDFNFYYTLLVDVQAWSGGVYFVKMEMAGRRETVKIVKQ